MWLFTQSGFYSIVRKQFGDQGKPFQIRSRSAKDLENLIQGAGMAGSVIHTKEADYQYRIIADRTDLEKIMRWQFQNLDYDNFKSRIGEMEDQRRRSSMYGKIWGLVYDHFRSK